VRLSKSWTLTRKEFDVFRRKRYILYSLVAVPLLLSLLLPLSILLTTSSSQLPPDLLARLLRSEVSIFIILAALLPAVVGSYSIIGEKLEKSLEPLLATPATDSELLLGKGLAAFIPSIAATYAGATLFIIVVDALASGRLGYIPLPDWYTASVLILAAPLACILSVEFNVIISSRVNDVRAAQQLGSLVILPLLGIFLLGQTNVVAPSVEDMLVVSGILLVADVVLSFVSRATFQREEILTKWK
jgi:ABC-2 type transport system permease protein